MKPVVSRRRFIKISAVAAPFWGSSCEKLKKLQQEQLKKKEPPPTYKDFTWEGTLLGAPAQITFKMLSVDIANLLFLGLTQEIKRLESIFSLHASNSFITVLNKVGKTPFADFESKELLTHAMSISAKTEGLFDPTIQSYWKTLEASRKAGKPLTEEERHTALKLVDYRLVNIAGYAVSFKRPNMAITLNGIAQGYITDKIYEYLRKNNMTSILIHLGEFRAIGSPEPPPSPTATEGLSPEDAMKATLTATATPWKLSFPDLPKYADLTADQLELKDGMALSASRGAGHTFSNTSDHHLINPHAGSCYDPDRTVVVQALDAMTADALSTACAVTSPDNAAQIIKRFPGARIIKDTMAS